MSATSRNVRSQCRRNRLARSWARIPSVCHPLGCPTIPDPQVSLLPALSHDVGGAAAETPLGFVLENYLQVAVRAPETLEFHLGTSSLHSGPSRSLSAFF